MHIKMCFNDWLARCQYVSLILIPDYGQVTIHEEDVRKGPQIIIQPQNQIVVANTDFVTLECAAIGNPQPKYKWFKAANRSQEVSNVQPTYEYFRPENVNKFEMFKKVLNLKILISDTP